MTLVAQDLQSGSETGEFTLTRNSRHTVRLDGAGGAVAESIFYCTEVAERVGILAVSSASAETGVAVFECGDPCE